MQPGSHPQSHHACLLVPTGGSSSLRHSRSLSSRRDRVLEAGGFAHSLPARLLHVSPSTDRTADSDGWQAAIREGRGRGQPLERQRWQRLSGCASRRISKRATTTTLTRRSVTYRTTKQRFTIQAAKRYSTSLTPSLTSFDKSRFGVGVEG